MADCLFHYAVFGSTVTACKLPKQFIVNLTMFDEYITCPACQAVRDAQLDPKVTREWVRST